MIAIQTEFRPDIPNVYAAADYREFREVLSHMDKALSAGLAEGLVSAWLEKWESAREGVVAPGRLVLMWRYAHYALRCNVARHLMGLPFREFSVRLADSELLQWFCSINIFGQRKAISKSSLERFDKWFDVRDVERVIREQLADLQRPDRAKALAGRDAGVRFDEIFADSTCVKANVHYPVDWVLLRDATRSLISTIMTIRRQGLKHRMPTPREFVTHINRLCIRMTHSRRRKDGRKYRKAVLREMKKLNQLVRRHGERYRALLETRWQETEWTEKQAQVVIKRMEESYGPVAAYCGDRGFDTKANADYLESENIFNGICPKAPIVMAERAGEPRFMDLQRRRGQTEARIGIFKNAYLGRPLRSKGFEHKRNTVAWCVLTHNLWVLARMKITSEQQRMAA